MTPAQARRLRADRLRACQARAQRLGLRVEAHPRGYGFRLLGSGENRRGRELGLPQIEARLDKLETLQRETTP